MTFPNGATRNFGYDDQGRLLSLTNLDPVAGNLASYSYAYDLNHATGTYNRLGQRVSMTVTVPAQGLNNHLTKYEYDNLYQLTKTTYPNVAPFNGEVHTWTYDGIGNRLTNTVNASTKTYSYLKIGANPLNWQRLLSDGVDTYTYAYPSSNPISKSGPSGTFNFIWNPFDGIERISGSLTAYYLYDHQGRRTSKTVGAATNSYLYDGLNLVRETGASPADYLFGPGIDEPLAMSRGGQTYYYATDALGSVNLVTNSGGTVQNKYLHDAWGVLRSQTGSLGNPFGYTAREFGDAGTLFYRARYYSPGIGRFLSEDPLRLMDGAGSYAYVDNASVSYSDPLGLIRYRIDPREHLWTKGQTIVKSVQFDYQCTCTGPGQWTAEYTAQQSYDMYYDDAETLAHERRHFAVHQRNVLEWLSYALPYERQPYRSQQECEMMNYVNRAWMIDLGRRFNWNRGHPDVDGPFYWLGLH